MDNVPAELKPYIQGNRLRITEGTFLDSVPLAAYLEQQKNLTLIAISEDVAMPDMPDGTPAHKALALAVSRSGSPNLLEVAIGGGHYGPPLAALCDGNRRSAIRLLKQAKDPSHALVKSECEEIRRQLPAMVAIASARGACATEHAMTQPDMVMTLGRIGSHASQYNIDTGVDAQIALLQPGKVVASAQRASEMVGTLQNDIQQG
jgi:hypothetical protein